MLPKWKVDKRSPILEEVIVEDRNGVGKYKLLAELIDVVLSDKGHWEGINDAFVNRVLQELRGIPTWPKRIRDIHFDNSEAKVVFDNSRLKILTDEFKVNPQRLHDILAEGEAALLKGEVISVFPIKIIAKPGTRMTAKYLHEWY